MGYGLLARRTKHSDIQYLHALLEIYLQCCKFLLSNTCIRTILPRTARRIVQYSPNGAPVKNVVSDQPEKGIKRAFLLVTNQNERAGTGAPTARQSCAARALATLRRKGCRHARNTARGKGQNMCNFVGNCGYLHELGEAAFGYRHPSGMRAGC